MISARSAPVTGKLQHTSVSAFCGSGSVVLVDTGPHQVFVYLKGVSGSRIKALCPKAGLNESDLRYHGNVSFQTNVVLVKPD